MKSPQHMLPRLTLSIFKILIILVVVVAFWAGSAYAYTATGLYVNGYGNVGVGYFSQSGNDREAKTSSGSSTIYYQSVNSRHWQNNLEWE
jgi:hypothetical protein